MIPSERRWRVLIVVSVAVFMATLDLFIVNIAFPDIEGNFPGTSVGTISWVLNGYAIVFAALLVPAGRFADRLGRKRAFLAGVVVFLLGSALCGIAPSIGTLIAARVIQAAGAAFLMPTSLALVLPEFAPAQRPVAISVWAAVGGTASAAGPPLGGLLVEVSWRLVFLVNIPIGLIALWFAVGLLRESRDASQQRPDLLGTVLLTAAIALLALGLVESPDWGWGSLRTIAAFVVSAAGLWLFWVRSHHHPSPVVDPELLRVRSFALANVAMLLFSVGFGALLFGEVLFMTEVWHDSVLRAGLQLACGPLLAAAFSLVAGRLARRVGQRRLAIIGLGLFTLGPVVWLWRIGVHQHYFADMFPGLVLAGTGVGLVFPMLSSIATAPLPPARFATGSAVVTMSRQIGVAIGVAIVVAIAATVDRADPVSTFRGAWIAMSIAAGAGFVIASLIGRVHQHQPVAQPAAAPAGATPNAAEA